MGAEASSDRASTDGPGRSGARVVDRLDASPVGDVAHRVLLRVAPSLTFATAHRHRRARATTLRAAVSPTPRGCRPERARLDEVPSSALALLACAPIGSQTVADADFGTVDDLVTPGAPIRTSYAHEQSRSTAGISGPHDSDRSHCCGRGTRRQCASGSAVTTNTRPTIRRLSAASTTRLPFPDRVLPEFDEPGGGPRTSNVCAPSRSRRSGQRSCRLREHEPTRNASTVRTEPTRPRFRHAN